jgi:5-methylcytosine-specific restriction enzyme subunit McrC
MGQVPVRNLWLLMLYASDLFRMHGTGKVGLEDTPEEIPDLIAELLAHAVERRLRRNLTAGYKITDGILSRIRGRVDLLTTERHRLLDRGKIACHYEELTINTRRNCFVRSALERVAPFVSSKVLSHRCRFLASSLARIGVVGLAPTKSEMGCDRFGRNDSDDRFMVEAAKLVFDLALLTESSGDSLLALTDREENWIRRLFEQAVGGFYQVVLEPEGWKVQCGTWLHWQIEGSTGGIHDILPSMKTDIMLQRNNQEHCIVVDTKFTSILHAGYHRTETLRSGYIYQIYSYLRSQEITGNRMTQASRGLLLHPSIGTKVDEGALIQGHAIRFATVDLASSTQEIRSQLRHVIECWPSENSENKASLAAQ